MPSLEFQKSRRKLLIVVMHGKYRRDCTQHSRFTKHDGWQLWDLSLSLNGNIAITGFNENTHRTYIDVYTNVKYFHSRDKPKIIYSKEFEKYSDTKWAYIHRRVSFYSGDTTILSGLGDKLEVIELIQDRIVKSRKIKLVNHGWITCLSVRETEIFIGFMKSNKITVYDVINLNEIKSIILQGIQGGYNPYDMIAIVDRIFVCVGEDKEESYNKSLIFEEKKGRILSELTKPKDSATWYLYSVGVSMNTLGIAAAVWNDSYHYKKDKHETVVFYSLLSENNFSFLIVEVENGVNRIRISDRGDRLITGNKWTGEVKVYDMAEVFTYSHFKKKLASALQTDECTKLANFFKINKDQADAILCSDTRSENLLFALEEKGILQPYNVERLIIAFEELTINPFCRHVAEIFLKTRSPKFYIKLMEKQGEKIGIVQTRLEKETMQLKEKMTEVEVLQKELRKLQEAHLKITNERDKIKAQHDKGQLQLSSLQRGLEASKKGKIETEKVLKQTEELHQKAIREKNEIETKLKQLQKEHCLQSISFEEGRSRQADIEKVKTTEIENLQKELRELNKRQEAHLKIKQERDKLKTERDEGQLQLSRTQEELEDSKNAKVETEKILKQTEELLQKIIQEKNEMKTELKQMQVAYSLGSMSLEEGRKNQAESGKKVSAGTTYDSSYTSPVRRKYLPELLLKDEFAKLLVKVAQKLNNSNCVMMAAYFNLPQSKIGFLQKESDTSGIELFHILKERNIINMYDVTQLQEVLSVLHLVEVNETLVIPYQNQIDPLLHQMNKSHGRNIE